MGGATSGRTIRLMRLLRRRPIFPDRAGRSARPGGWRCPCPRASTSARRGRGWQGTPAEGSDLGQAGERVTKAAAAWAAAGARSAGGREAGDRGPPSVLLPAGAGGAAAMIFANFHAIEKDTAAAAYVIAVGHL